MKPQGHPYQELAAKIVSMIESGTMAAGTRLPSVRALAKDHGVSAMTAQKALNLLAADGYAEAVSGLGYFVKDRPTVSQADEPSAVDAMARQLDDLQGTVAELRARVEALEGRSRL